MKPKSFSMREAISFGWEEMKKNFMFFLMFIIMIFATEGMANSFFTKDPGFSLPAQTGVMLSLIISTLVGFAVIKISLDAANNKSLAFKNVKKVLPRYLDYFLVQIIISITVFIGLVFLVFPGIIWGVQFSMAPYLIVEKKLNPIEALKESSRITKGKRWRLFVFGLLLFLINVAGVLVFIVGIFSTFPATMIAYASVYNKLKE